MSGRGAGAPALQLWRMQCVGYCKGQVPEISGTQAQCYAQLEEHDFVLLPEALEAGVIELSHLDNAGAHVCRWLVEPLKPRRCRRVYWFSYHRSAGSESVIVGTLTTKNDRQ